MIWSQYENFAFILVVHVLGSVVHCVNRELTQQDGCKTQDGRMTKNVARDCIPGLARHFISSFCRPESYSRPVA